MRYEHALTDRSKCFVCSNFIAKDALRILYCLRVSSSVRDKRWSHDFCAAGYPADRRAWDIGKVQAWLGDASLPLVLRRQFEAVETLLDTPGAASST